MSYPAPSGHEAPGQQPRGRGKLPFVLGGIGVALVLCLGGALIAGVPDDKAKESFDEGYAQGVAAQTFAPVTTPATSAPASTATTTAPATKAATKATTAPAQATEAAVTTIKVPNGVGMDYQSAQDLWRSAGLIVAPATDATGAHRLPLIDSNWVVLAQDLKAGSKVPDGTLITATVKKYTDD